MNKILCFLGFHKYIEDQRNILQVINSKARGAKLSVIWCKHCHKSKDLEREIARTLIVS